MLSGLVMGICMAGLALYLQFLDTSPGLKAFSNDVIFQCSKDKTQICHLKYSFWIINFCFPNPCLHHHID